MYALLLMNEQEDYIHGISDLIDIFACDVITGDLLVFRTMNEADFFREKNSINSQIIELPVY